jgi:streptogramin lyase
MNNVTRLALALSMLTTAAAPLAASAAPAALTSGAFASGAHATSGTATIYKLDDGSRILRLSNFSTSNGPKVHVILADHAISGNNVEDAKSVDLGDLKGNTGNQNYAIPAGVNLGDVKSVAIYCERFKVNFGSANLK